MAIGTTLDKDQLNLLAITDLLHESHLEDSDILLFQDEENTKRITFREFRDALITDEDNPSEHKLFSSFHINSLLQEYENVLEKDFGRLSGEIKSIKENYSNTEQVREMLNEFAKTVPDLSETNNIKEALDAKRDIQIPITGADIATGSDEDKIQPENLSYKVISMMVGTTPIDTATVPEGGWNQEDIAPKAINASKLSRQYRVRGHFPEGNINLFVDDGLYLLGATVEGLPTVEDDDEPEPRLLEVLNFGPNNNIIQRVYYVDDKGEDTRPYFERKCLLSRIAVTKFGKVYPITESFKITREMINDTFLNAGEPEITDVFDLVIDNDYHIKRGTKNLPNDQYDFTVSVRNYGERIEYQAKSITLDRCEIFICNAYYNSSRQRVHTEWYNVSSTKLSRLEGKKVHLFGDGVCFGLGSTDIPSKSWPALLSSRYGVSINNHALGDATFGHYEDEVLAERSVIQQIETARVDDADIAILWAGSNDYRTVLSVIGDNDSDNDRSFKGSINLCIKKLLEKKPDIKILLVTPLFRARLNADDIRNSDDTLVGGRTLKDFSKAMIEISEYNHIPCLDLHSTSMINKMNFTVYLKDRLYLNDTGHDLIADKIFKALDFYC